MNTNKRDRFWYLGLLRTTTGLFKRETRWDNSINSNSSCTTLHRWVGVKWCHRLSRRFSLQQCNQCLKQYLKGIHLARIRGSQFNLRIIIVLAIVIWASATIN